MYSKKMFSLQSNSVVSHYSALKVFFDGAPVIMWAEHYCCWQKSSNWCKLFRFICIGVWIFFSVETAFGHKHFLSYPLFTGVLNWSPKCFGKDRCQLDRRDLPWVIPATCSALSLFQEGLSVFCCPIDGGCDRLHPGMPRYWPEGQTHCQAWMTLCSFIFKDILVPVRNEGFVFVCWGWKRNSEDRKVTSIMARVKTPTESVINSET